MSIAPNGDNRTEGGAYVQDEIFLSKYFRWLVGARVDKFSGLSVDYAERIGACAIIRSLRAVTDFDYELQMAQMNKQMKPNLETVFLTANPKLFFTASRLIKEVASYGKRLPELVPEMVMNRLRKKLGVPAPGGSQPGPPKPQEKAAAAAAVAKRSGGK